jgi:hypothetical protein
MKRITWLAIIQFGWAAAAWAGTVGIGGTGNSWSQKPWCSS